jgi:hypothetical protein
MFLRSHRRQASGRSRRRAVEEVEAYKHGLTDGAVAVQGIEDRDAVRPATQASPSRVNDRARSLAAVLAIAGYRSLQS